MHSTKLGFQSKFAVPFIALILGTLWLALHGYHGLAGDGQIYAFQAFARLHPNLGADLYLQNTSQDQFTWFSPLYAYCIGLLGLQNAARSLTLVFTVWFLAAAWNFASAVTPRDTAWLAAAFLLIAASDYGGSRVFHILDPFLTARLPAEALVITSLSLYVHGMRRLAVFLAFGALFIHPLMALPGLFVVFGLWAPVRLGIVGAIGGVFATLVLAVVAISLHPAPHTFFVMDAAWLEVVRERSQFLFLQLWSIGDWGVNTRPLISLGFTAIVVSDERIFKLCVAAALVGAAGIGVALIGGLIGPVAFLVQGQAWRWVWLAAFIGAALVPCTALQAWRDEKCGPLCALLLTLGWTLPGAAGTACVSLALILWRSRAHIGIGLESSLRLAVAHLNKLKHWVLSASRTTVVPVLLAATLLLVSIWTFPAAFKQAPVLSAPADVREFSDWTNVIPPTSTVLITPQRDVGAFVWFTLERPNYAALNQSSGVVFSRTTALEVRRRSELLLPLMDPDWKIRTELRAKSGDRNKKAVTRPLTSETLIQICADLQLGFVISPTNVGFNALHHEHAGPWKDWNLYDCAKIRSASPVT